MIPSNDLRDRDTCRREHPGHCMVVLGVQWYCMALYDFRLYLHRYVMHCSGNVLPTDPDEMDECPLDLFGEPVVHAALREDASVTAMNREKPVRQDLTLYHAAEAERSRTRADAFAGVDSRVADVIEEEEDSVPHPGEVHENDGPEPKVKYDPFTLTPGHAMPMFPPVMPPSSHITSLSSSSSSSSAETTTHNTLHIANTQDCCALSPSHAQQIIQAKQQDITNSGGDLFAAFVPDELCNLHREEHCMLHVDAKPFCMPVNAFVAHVADFSWACKEQELAQAQQYDHAPVDAAKIAAELCPGC